MTIFDRERQKYAYKLGNQAEETAREAVRLAEQLQADAARREQESISQQYLDKSLFRKLLGELAFYLNRPKKGVRVEVKPVFHQQFDDPSHEDYGAVGLALEERRTDFKLYPWPFGKPRSYKYVKYIEIIALPNGTIKVKGSPLGMTKTTLTLDQWRDPRTGSSRKDVAERAIDKAWKSPIIKWNTGDWLGKKMEDWDTEDIVAWEGARWWQKIK